MGGIVCVGGEGDGKDRWGKEGYQNSPYRSIFKRSLEWMYW